MAFDTSFDYDRLLSLDQAKLVGRTRINSLGSYELTINYNKIPSTTKEECLEWLESERLSVENPIVSNKTYDGIWKCVSIAYDEGKSIIQQIFKIDSSVGDLGNWDGEPPEPLEAVWDAQFGDISRVSDGMLIEKAYYWKITNPEDVNLPSGATDITGQIWTKTANDNGDGTYDVVVSREIEENLGGTNTAENYAFTEVTEVDTNDVAKTVPVANLGDEVSVTNTPQENGLFRTTETTKTGKRQTATNTTVSDGFTEVTDIATNDSAQPAPTAVDGKIKSVTNRPLPNGKYDTTSTTKTFVNQTGNAEASIGGENGSGGVTSIYVSGEQQYPDANQEYEFYYQYVCKLTTFLTGLNNASFYDTGTTNAGEIVWQSVLFSDRTKDDDYALWNDGVKWIISLTGDVGGSPSNYFSSTTFDGLYTATGSWVGTASIGYTLNLEEVTGTDGTGAVTSLMAPLYAGWKGITDSTWEIYCPGTSWLIIDNTNTASPIYASEHVATNLTSYGWDDANLVVQIGKNPPSYEETSVTYTNSVEFKFVSDGGVVPTNGVADPVAGEEITISNSPLDNGKFNVKITTRTVSRQRVPALFDSVIYASNGDPSANAFIMASNASFEDFQIDMTTLGVQKLSSNNSVSVNINKYGLYDYTIRSTNPLPLP